MLVEYILFDLFVKISSVASNGMVQLYGVKGDYNNALTIAESSLVREGYIRFESPVNWDGTEPDAQDIAEEALRLLDSESDKVSQFVV